MEFILEKYWGIDRLLKLFAYHFRVLIIIIKMYHVSSLHKRPRKTSSLLSVDRILSLVINKLQYQLQQAYICIISVLLSHAALSVNAKSLLRDQIARINWPLIAISHEHMNLRALISLLLIVFGVLSLFLIPIMPIFMPLCCLLRYTFAIVDPFEEFILKYLEFYCRGTLK
jgi:hypothetical protein